MINGLYIKFYEKIPVSDAELDSNDVLQNAVKPIINFIDFTLSLNICIQKVKKGQNIKIFFVG